MPFGYYVKPISRVLMGCVMAQMALGPPLIAKPRPQTHEIRLDSQREILSTTNMQLTGDETPYVLRLNPITPIFPTQNEVTIQGNAIVYLPPKADAVHFKPRTYGTEKFGKEMKQHYLKNFLIYSFFLGIIAVQELGN